MSKKKIYFADFETTKQNEQGETRVYLWAIVSGEEEHTGNSIKGCIDFMLNNTGIYYFHNLKFDFAFILDWLIKHDIIPEILEKNGLIYSAKFEGVELRDSLNFMHMTLREVGENYCKIHKKTSIDYDTPFDHEATEEEKAYCVNDCRVLEEGLNNYMSAMHDVLTESGAVNTAKNIGKRLTNAGIAYSAFKEISNLDKVSVKTKPAEYRELRHAYWGGYVYSKPNDITFDVHMLDCNSMYPSVYAEEPMPVGKGVRCGSFKELKKFNFYIVHVAFGFDLKPGYVPIIGKGYKFMGKTEYQTSSNGETVEFTYCNIDLDLIFRFYDIYNFRFIWGVGYETIPNLFKRYAEIFSDIKARKKGVKRAAAKVMLNSPYGKTAKNGETDIKNYFVDDESNTVKSEVIATKIDEDGFEYLPIAIAITAYSRRKLLTTAEKIGFYRVQYMDTDSIKYTGDTPVGIDIHPTRLGAWKDEGTALMFKTIAPKKYITYMPVTKEILGKKVTSNGISVTCAGFSKAALAESVGHGYFCDEKTAVKYMLKFDSGLKMPCLQSKRVSGGRVLLPVEKEIT